MIKKIFFHQLDFIADDSAPTNILFESNDGYLGIITFISKSDNSKSYELDLDNDIYEVYITDIKI